MAKWNGMEQYGASVFELLLARRGNFFVSVRSVEGERAAVGPIILNLDV